jgi:hypothetical protein
MNKPSILKSVSVSEMLHMREQGLSNAEIADKIGCSHVTVIRHIGKAPFVKSGRGRKKKENDTLGLPPVGDKPIPEMPHKSFVERCEEVLHKPDTEKKKIILAEDLGLPERTYAPDGDIHRFSVLKKPETVKEALLHMHEDMNTLTLADIARKAHQNAIAEIARPTEDNTRIGELIAVFGEQAVATWLKVSLYDMRIPDCRPMSRKKMLEMLKIMNAGGASV